MYICICTYMCLYIHFLFIYIYIHMEIYICMCLYIQIYIYVWVATHKQTSLFVTFDHRHCHELAKMHGSFKLFGLSAQPWYCRTLWVLKGDITILLTYMASLYIFYTHKTIQINVYIYIYYIYTCIHKYVYIYTHTNT